MLGPQVTLPVHVTMLRHLITHPATRFILPKMQPTTKDSTLAKTYNLKEMELS
jgi:hypothetical protein